MLREKRVTIISRPEKDAKTLIMKFKNAEYLTIETVVNELGWDITRVINAFANCSF